MSDVQVEVFVVDRLGRSEFYGFAILAGSDAITMGQVDPRGKPIVDPRYEAVIARVRDEIVGILVFDPKNAIRAKVSLMYVLPDYRRRGVLGMMLDELVKLCERTGRRAVEIEVPIQNDGAARALLSVGAAVVSQRLQIRLQ